MRQFISAAFLLCAISMTGHGQLVYSEDDFRVFDRKGNPASLADIVSAAGKVDVIFFGELHDDVVGHAVQAEAFRRIVAEYSAKRPVILSLEMFERDVQTVLDEYLRSLITEQHFLSSSRPWPNYKTDYRPLVEFAKEKKLPVIAANAPRRYVNMVSRGGRQTLNGLSRQVKMEWLPPLPYAEASEAYANKFKAMMGGSGEARMGLDNILSSQSLWDASMAYWVSQGLKKNKNALVVHLNGGFHTENRLGTVEHFLKYRKKGRAVVVTMRYEDDFKKFDPAKHLDLGDFVVLTKKVPSGGHILNEIRRRITEHAKHLKSLRARVKMVRHNAQLWNSDESDGTVVYVARDGARRLGVRVDWIRPAERFVVSGDQYALYMPRLALAYTGRFSRDSKNTPIQTAYKFMNMTAAAFRDDFVTNYIGEVSLGENLRTWHLRLEPKRKEAFKSMEAWIDADGMPRQFRVTEYNGDTTTVQLSEIRKNDSVPGGTFELKFPPGTKINKS